MFLWIVVLKVEYAPFIRINYMRIQIFVISFMLPSIGHMYMSMQKVFGPISIKQCPKYLKSLVRQISSVIELICRRVRHQNIKSSL